MNMREIMKLVESDIQTDGQMDPEAEKNARSMGFNPDEDWFHGTTGNIRQFDASLLGSVTGARNTGLGFFFTSDEYHASVYAGKRGTIIDAVLRIRNPLVLRQPAEYVTEDVGDFLDQYLRDSFSMEQYPTAEEYVEFRDYFKRKGHDGIIVAFKSGTKVAIVFEANQIRDRGAAFDPSKSASADLLA